MKEIKGFFQKVKDGLILLGCVVIGIIILLIYLVQAGINFVLKPFGKRIDFAPDFFDEGLDEGLYGD